MQYRPLPSKATIEDLTPQQAEFVSAFIELGGLKDCAPDAALEAGYGRGDRKKAARSARDLLRDERIISAIRDELVSRFGASAVLGLHTLKELCESGPPSVRLAAAKELVDRGYGPVMSRTATLQATTTVEDLLTQLDEPPSS